MMHLFTFRKSHLDQIAGRSDDVRASPHSNRASPVATMTPQDKRAELRRLEQERRRREAVSFYLKLFRSSLSLEKSNRSR